MVTPVPAMVELVAGLESKISPPSSPLLLVTARFCVDSKLPSNVKLALPAALLLPSL